MQLGLTVTGLVLGVTVLFAIAGCLIERIARNQEKSAQAQGSVVREQNMDHRSR